MKKCFVLVSALLLASFLFTSIAGADLTAIKSGKRDVFIGGTRQSDIPWGQGPVNYQAGASATQRFSDKGWVDISIAADASGTFGTGSGYKMLVQFWNDEENFVAFGIIKDPGAAPWGGITLMVEGAAYGQPIGGYWPQGHGGFDENSSSHHFSVSWGPRGIEFVIDHIDSQKMIFNINMSNPSFSCLGAARMPGDSLHGTFKLNGFSMDKTGNPPQFSLVTWDPEFANLGNITY